MLKISLCVMLISTMLVAVSPASVMPIKKKALRESFESVAFSHLGLGQSESQCPPSQFHELFNFNAAKFQIDDYETTTEDGYILRMFRIRLSSEFREKLSPELQSNIKKPILLVHAMTGSSDLYFVNGEDKSLGFYLVNQGYDVWTGDSRGSKFSKGHTNPDLPDKEFYAFSWSHMGLHDVPAFFHKILENYTNPDQKITYFGHSQGTSQMFVSLLEPSSRPFVEKHLHNFVAIAPITFLNHVEYSALLELSKFEKLIDIAANTFGLYDMIDFGCSNDNGWVKILQFACELSGIFCKTPVEWITGFDLNIDNLVDVLPVLEEHGPSGTSAMAVDHYGQLIKGGANGEPIWRDYDYHSAEANQKAYGQDTPPDWDFSTWTAPVTLVQLDADTLGTQENTNNLLNVLPKGTYQVRHILGWDHGTPLWAKDPTPLFKIADEVLATA